jgi:hypothetical protein
MFLRFITRGDHRTIVLVTAYRDAEGKPRQKTQSLGSYRHQGHDLAGNWLGPWKPVDEWIQEHNAHALANQRSPEQIASRITAMVEVDNAHRHQSKAAPTEPRGSRDRYCQPNRHPGAKANHQGNQRAIPAQNFPGRNPAHAPETLPQGL